MTDSSEIIPAIGFDCTPNNIGCERCAEFILARCCGDADGHVHAMCAFAHRLGVIDVVADVRE